MWVLLLIALLPASPSAAGSDRDLDTVYVVEADRPGVYVAVTGRILEATRSRLMLERTGRTYVYTRDAVDHVVAAASHDEAVQETIKEHWTRSEPVGIATITEPLSEVVRKLPIFGAPLASLLPYLSGPLQLLVLVVVIVVVVGYGVNQLVVSLSNRRLGLEKLELEVLSLRTTLAGQLPQAAWPGATGERPITAAPHPAATADLAEGSSVPPPARAVRKSGHLAAIYGWLLARRSDEREAELRAEWVEHWRSLSTRAMGRNGVLLYFALRVGLNWFATLYAFAFAVGGAMGPYIVYTDETGAFEGEELFTSAIYVLFAIGGIALLSRLRRKYVLMKATYREARKQGDPDDAARESTDPPAID